MDGTHPAGAPLVLMLHSVVPETYGLWVLPKGGVESEEGIQEAAMRELAEEAGIAPDQYDLFPDPRRLPAAPVSFLIEEYVHFPRRDVVAVSLITYFIARFRGDRGSVRTTAAHSGHSWVPLPEVLAAPVLRFGYPSLPHLFNNIRLWATSASLDEECERCLRGSIHGAE